MTGIAVAIAEVLGRAQTRGEKAKTIAARIRGSRNYRWVGLYDVSPGWVSLLAYSGPGEPVYPRFPASQGLTGAAIQQKQAVIVGGVRTDPRYLTAFGSTLSEIIIPVLDGVGSVVVGTIDVESELVNAFSAADHRMLENAARAAGPLWREQR